MRHTSMSSAGAQSSAPGSHAAQNVHSPIHAPGETTHQMLQGWQSPHRPAQVLSQGVTQAPTPGSAGAPSHCSAELPQRPEGSWPDQHRPVSGLSQGAPLQNPPHPSWSPQQGPLLTPAGQGTPGPVGPSSQGSLQSPARPTSRPPLKWQNPFRPEAAPSANLRQDLSTSNADPAHGMSGQGRFAAPPQQHCAVPQAGHGSQGFAPANTAAGSCPV